MNDQKSNPNAAQIRLGPASPSKTAGQRKHDLRIGKQPEYVDEKRSPENRILIKPKTADEMKKRAVERRNRKPRKRAMKSNAAVSFSGIITFGHLAHLRFERLTANQQDDAFLELAQSIADRHGADLTGLVVHVDEAGLHAHFQMDAYDENGDALSDKVKRADLRALQDLTAEVMAKHCPGIERGQGKVERLKAGASPAEVVYKKPAEMRRALAQDLEAAKTQKTDLEAERDKLAARIAKLEAFGDDLTKKGEKQLEMAKSRLQTKEDEIAAVEQKLAAARKSTVEAQNSLTQAQEALGATQTATEALKALQPAAEALRGHYEAIEAQRKAKEAQMTEITAADAERALEWLLEPATRDFKFDAELEAEAARTIEARIDVAFKQARVTESFDLEEAVAKELAAPPNPNKRDLGIPMAAMGKIFLSIRDLWVITVKKPEKFPNAQPSVDVTLKNFRDEGFYRERLRNWSFHEHQQLGSFTDLLARTLKSAIAVTKDRATAPVAPPSPPPVAAKPILDLPAPLQAQVMDALAPQNRAPYDGPSGPSR